MKLSSLKMAKDLSKTRYGLVWESPNGKTPMEDLFIEIRCFLGGPVISASPGWLGKLQHFVNIVDMIFNRPESPQKFLWHPWAMTFLEELCLDQGKSDQVAPDDTDDKEVSFVGCAGSASSGKSEVLALWGFINWLCAPQKTMVLILSNEKAQAKLRVWASLSRFWNACEAMNFPLPGRMIPSQSLISGYGPSGAVDMMTGMKLIAAGEGESEASVNEIQGYKQERLFLLCDEGPLIRKAILDAPSNLIKGGRKIFQMVMTGNPASYFDTFGLFVLPHDSDWNKITLNTERWKMKRGGYCIRFDGHRSPNVLAGRVVYPFLIRQSDLDADAIKYGSIDAPGYYSQNRGFFTPTGGESGVYSSQELIQSGAMGDRMEWSGNKRDRIFFLDPQFTTGGDGSWAGYADVGEMANGRMGLIVGSIEILQDDVSSKIPISHRQATAFKEWCQKHSCTSTRHAGLDSTGGGEPFADTLSVIWAEGFLRLNFSGAATDQIVGTASKKACDLYANKVTEINLLAKSLMRTKQIAGIDSSTASEMIARKMAEVDAKKRQRIESKKEMRKRTGSSPNRADVFAGLIYLARERFGLRATEIAGREFKPPLVENPAYAWAFKSKAKIEDAPVLEGIGGGWASQDSSY